jgi:hypothetical protein
VLSAVIKQYRELFGRGLTLQPALPHPFRGSSCWAIAEPDKIAIVTSPVEVLVLDLLEWLSRQDQSYEGVKNEIPEAGKYWAHCK